MPSPNFAETHRSRPVGEREMIIAHKGKRFLVPKMAKIDENQAKSCKIFFESEITLKSSKVKVHLEKPKNESNEIHIINRIIGFDIIQSISQGINT